MAIIKLEDYSHELVLTAAKEAAAAAMGAPRITPGLTMDTVILTGEDLDPLVRMLKIFAGPDGQYSRFIYGDYLMGKHFMETGEPYAMLLVGAKTSPSELAWDCGACGFATCGEFNCYVRENRGVGLLAYGPSCNWKMIDFGLAMSQASASIYARNIDSRMQGSYGVAAMLLGVMEDMDVVLATSIGPLNRGIWQEWYSRPEMKGSFTQENIYEMLVAAFGFQFAGFAGDGIPLIKRTDDWFWDPYKAGKGPMPEILDVQAQVLEEAGELIFEYQSKRAEREAEE
jgi:uncharacterized ferredoxin-like protein